MNRMARLFISQSQLDRWAQDGKVNLADDVMNIPGLGRSFRIRGAVHFERVVEGKDTHALVGKVKTEDQLSKLGAESYGASVIIGEVGYEATEGFVGVPVEADGTGGASGLLRLED
jgi:hypothetical protein